MRKYPLLSAAALSVVLSACGSDSPEPTEQIIVREPGQAVEPAVANSDDAAAGPSALAADGKKAFAACTVCHSVEAGGPAGIGPSLYGVVGRAAGSVEGYGYSDALGSSGITWSAEELDAFIANPTAKVPGTSMSAGAVGDAEKRAAIIAYLSSLSE